MKILKVHSQSFNNVNPNISDDPLESNRSIKSYTRSEIEKLLDYKRQLKNAKEQLDDLKVYLASEKFYKDPTVQKMDIINRLPDIYI